jgi:hypothetical protein
MKKVDRAHTIQTSLCPRSSSAIRIFSTQLTRRNYHTDDRMRRSTRNTKSVIVNGGRPNPCRIPLTSVERKRQIFARSTHQEGILYGSKLFQHPENLRMRWLGPYMVKSVTNGGDVQLIDLASADLQGMINGSQLNMYKDTRPPTA